MLRRPPRSTLFPTRRSSDLLLDRDHLHVRDDAVLAAEIQHLLGLGDAADHGAGHGLAAAHERAGVQRRHQRDRKSTRLNSSHMSISYAVFCLKKKKNKSNSL